MIRKTHRLVDWIGILIHWIDPIHIINVAVAVVINPVPRNLTRIAPHVCREVFVRVPNASVEHCHHHIRVAGRERPGIRRPDPCQRHLAIKPRVVRDHRWRAAQFKKIIWLRRDHVRPLPQSRQCLRVRLPWPNTNVLPANAVEPMPHFVSQRLLCLRRPSPARPVPKLHQQFPLNKFRTLRNCRKRAKEQQSRCVTTSYSVHGHTLGSAEGSSYPALCQAQMPHLFRSSQSRSQGFKSLRATAHSRCINY